MFAVLDPKGSPLSATGQWHLRIGANSHRERERNQVLMALCELDTALSLDFSLHESDVSFLFQSVCARFSVTCFWPSLTHPVSFPRPKAASAVHHTDPVRTLLPSAGGLPPPPSRKRSQPTQSAPLLSDVSGTFTSIAAGIPSEEYVLLSAVSWAASALDAYPLPSSGTRLSQ